MLRRYALRLNRDRETPSLRVHERRLLVDLDVARPGAEQGAAAPPCSVPGLDAREPEALVVGDASVVVVDVEAGSNAHCRIITNL